MDHEHTPNPGPGLWVGAGALFVVGGGSVFLLVGAPTEDATGDVAMLVFGGALVLVGAVMVIIGIRRTRSSR